jgi:hypothetical protein
MTRYRTITLGLIAAWFLFALTASALHLFLNPSGRVGIGVAMAALIPILVFSLWFASSASFRRFAFSLNPSILTLVQSWRILGFTFVLLQAHRILPALFALPAGYGDMFIGMTATFVALKLANPRHRSTFIAWQILGMADLVMAVGLGTTARLFSPNDVSMVPMTVLPLSLVPTFIVPLLFIFHVICVAQALAWKGGLGYARDDARAGAGFAV